MLPGLPVIDEAALKPPIPRNLRLSIYPYLGLGSLIQLVFWDAWEQGVREDIRSVKVDIYFGYSENDIDHFISQMVGHRQHYEKWWNEFTVTKEESTRVMIRASM
jgi:predicted RNA-binding protein with PIN domain